MRTSGHLCHHCDRCDRCDSSYYNIYIISIEALLYSNPLIHYTHSMYILSVTSVTPVTPLDLKWHVFLGWFFTIGQDVVYVGGGKIDGLLVFAGLAVAGGDEFACKIWGLIGAVAGVELRSFLGGRRYGRVRPIPADCRDSF